MKAISTKYLPATNTRGSRIKAHDSDGHSVTIGYPHELSGAAVHAKAAVSLCLKMGWEGDLISGGTKDGYVFVFAESERFLNLTRDPRRASLPTPTAQGSKCEGDAYGDGYPGTRYFHKSPGCPGHD